ncbi:MAG: hypothetical protein QOG20_6832, partial [Pseudonocardiales bacterium]|nr:hypothetical protein [Pseudonocardiales bacterium]
MRLRHLLIAAASVVATVAVTTSVATAAVPVPPSAPALPASLLVNPSGLPNGPTRDYGTPTAAPGKTCPFTGNVPVSLPVGSLPVGNSLPGLGGVVLPGPTVPTTVYAELCMSESALADARAGHPPAVLVLVHGITYGTWYWDLPYEPQTYSAVNYLNGHGYATLNIDRIGEGRSGHPISPLVTSATNADAVHQLVQKLKAGEIGGLTFPHVGLVGHSYGTITNWRESAVYNDTDINIGTGYSDGINPVTAGAFVTQAEPAIASPLNADQPWAIDPGYLQPLPGSRSIPQLYYMPNTDPEVIATDERLANTDTAEELGTFLQSEVDGSRKNILVPTFLIDGQHDLLVCGNNAEKCATAATTSSDPATVEADASTLHGWQGSVMNSKACFRAAVIPDAAHDINFHRNAQQLYAQIAYFADQAMGVHGENVGSYRATCDTAGGGLSDTVPHVNAPGVTPPPLDSNPVPGV